MFTRTFFSNLRQASFRGAKFEVDDVDASGGRRLVKHEYPLRDEPYTEDMKVKTLHLEIDADEDATITTKKYTVNASEGVAYNTPSYQLGSEGGATSAKMNATMMCAWSGL